MSQPLLQIKAGEEAYNHIQKYGLKPEDISAVVSAAGGPKWFNVFGLTRYIIGDFLSGNQHPIDFLGASVGSWQMTAALSSNPTAAMDRLRQAYANHIYEEELNPIEITAACKHFINEMIGVDHDFILNHPNRRLHVVTARGKGILSNKNKIVYGLGFGVAFLSNLVSRGLMRHTAERTIFSSSDGHLPYYIDQDPLPTIQNKLNKDNIIQALQASGTIPFMMQQQFGIPGAKDGAYWDGGMTDYHISLPYNTKGLVLQPHFYPFVYAGWFDKMLPWNRHANPSNMSKAVLISPTEAFVKSLPLGRISEMKDGKFFGVEQDKRVKYWLEISERSLELGEAFKDLVESGRLAEVIRRY